MTNEGLQTGNDGINKDEEYRNVLKELGIKKSKEEPITKDELAYIFMHSQEAFGMGS